MDDSADLIPIAAAILLALQRARSSVEEHAQTSIGAALANLDDLPREQQLQAIERAFSILGDYPSARNAVLTSLLPMTGDPRSPQSGLVRSLISQLSPATRHGVVYVCPLDPDHYRRRSADPAALPRCPLHDVQLRPQEPGQ